MAAESLTNTITLAVFFKDYLPVFLSAIAMFFSIYCFRKTASNTTQNLRLQASFDDFNIQRHWRREKIYNLTDEVFDLSTDYWLCDESNLNNKRSALFLKCKIGEIEENANVLKIDVSREIMELMHHATGGEFECSSRCAIPCTHEKFNHIINTITKIKSKLS